MYEAFLVTVELLKEEPYCSIKDELDLENEADNLNLIASSVAFWDNLNPDLNIDINNAIEYFNEMIQSQPDCGITPISKTYS